MIKKSNIKSLTKIAGLILVILSFVFIIYSFTKVDYNLIVKNFHFSWIPLIFTLIILYSVIVIVYAVGWKLILNVCTKVKLSFRFIIGLYMRANIAKYLPGNVFHFAGRHVMLREKKVSHEALLFSNGFEIAMLILTSTAVVGVSIITGIIDIPEKVKTLIDFRFLLIALFTGFIFIISISIYLIIKNKFIEKIKYIFALNNFIYLFMIFLIYLSIFVIIGCILFTIFFMLGLEYNGLQGLFFIIAVFSLAWVGGYIVPGAPGGMGVREAIMIIMLSPIYGESMIVLSSIILRAITVAGDTLAYFIGRHSFFQEKK